MHLGELELSSHRLEIMIDLMKVVGDWGEAVSCKRGDLSPSPLIVQTK
jgi:hypothetical protein